MLGPGQHRDSLIAVQVRHVDVVWIEIVEHGIGDENVDAAKQVDQFDQTREPNPRVFVDVHMEVALDGGNGGGGTAIGVGGIDLRAAAGRKRDPEVARDGKQSDVFAGRIDPDQDHRLGQWGFVLPVVVRAQ